MRSIRVRWIIQRWRMSFLPIKNKLPSGRTFCKNRKGRLKNLIFKRFCVNGGFIALELRKKVG